MRVNPISHRRMLSPPNPKRTVNAWELHHKNYARSTPIKLYGDPKPHPPKSITTKLSITIQNNQNKRGKKHGASNYLVSDSQKKCRVDSFKSDAGSASKECVEPNIDVFHEGRYRKPFSILTKIDQQNWSKSSQEPQVGVRKWFGKTLASNSQDISHIITTYKSIIDFWNKDVQFDLMEVDSFFNLDVVKHYSGSVSAIYILPEESHIGLKRKRDELVFNYNLPMEDLDLPTLKKYKVVEQIKSGFVNISAVYNEEKKSGYSLIETVSEETENRILSKVSNYDFTFTHDNYMSLDEHAVFKESGVPSENLFQIFIKEMDEVHDVRLLDASSSSHVMIENSSEIINVNSWITSSLFQYMAGTNDRFFPFDPGSKWNSIGRQRKYKWKSFIYVVARFNLLRVWFVYLEDLHIVSKDSHVTSHVTKMQWVIAWISVFCVNICILIVMDALLDSEFDDDVSISTGEKAFNQVEIFFKHLCSAGFRLNSKKSSQVPPHHHFVKYGNPYTPHANKYINLVGDYACALCTSKCFHRLLVVAFVLSRFSTRTFIFSRSMIDNLKKCWVSLDTDHEISILVCSCHLRLPIWYFLLFLDHHNNLPTQTKNDLLQAENTHELTSFVSSLRGIWTRNKMHAYDNVNPYEEMETTVDEYLLLGIILAPNRCSNSIHYIDIFSVQVLARRIASITLSQVWKDFWNFRRTNGTSIHWRPIFTPLSTNTFNFEELCSKSVLWFVCYENTSSFWKECTGRNLLLPLCSICV